MSGGILRVEFRRVFVVPVAAFIEQFPAEWEGAQTRGLNAHAFALESIEMMGEDIADLATRDDSDVDVVTL